MLKQAMGERLANILKSWTKSWDIGQLLFQLCCWIRGPLALWENPKTLRWKEKRMVKFQSVITTPNLQLILSSTEGYDVPAQPPPEGALGLRWNHSEHQQ